MAVKEWFRKLQPVQLYLVLFFTTAFFIVELVASYVTHSLTLLLTAYHMFCNIIALAGCIASIKYRQRDNVSVSGSTNSIGNSATCISMNENDSLSVSLSNQAKQTQSERRMKNTFGWARIDIVTMLACCVFLASFCFSLLVEALQTLVHIDHLDEMHHPLPVMCIGAFGLLLNAFCYIIIGGYTFNQGVFLHITSNGEVVLKRSEKPKPAQEGDEQLSSHANRSPLTLPKTQGLCGMCRDVLGCVLVMVASIIVYFTDSSIAKFVDPIFAIVSAILLLVLSLPYMKESGLILLQTIPNHINIDSLKQEILKAFPGIVNVHDFHVWQLTGEKVISTVHIIFMDPTVYASIIEPLKAYFVEMGITQVTIQPEFQKMKPRIHKSDCLIMCQGGKCRLSQCCSKEIGSNESGHSHHSINKNFDKKEIIPSESDINLTRFECNTNEVSRKKNVSTQSICSQMNATIYSQTDDSMTSCQKIYAITVEVNEPKHSDDS